MASDYRGVSDSNQQGTNGTRQYSQVAKRTSFPKKQQAIILNVDETLKLSDYVIAVGNLVEAKNILFASRISNNRICIYLSTPQLVDTITQQPSIKIKELDIGLRRLITPAKRLILSNVCPSIPHDVLENEILKLGYTTASPVSFLRAGIPGEEYAHVLSFRRQIYVLPNEDIELPPSIVITFENISYRIFISSDSITCFVCKQIGHIAKQCPSQPTDYIVEDGGLHSVAPSEGNKEIENNTILTDNVETTTNAETSLQQNATQENTAKRPPPSPTTSSISFNLENLENIPLTQTPTFAHPKDTRPNRHKKMKKSTSEEDISFSELMKPVESFVNDTSNSHILNFQQISSFLENAFGSSDPLSLAYTYTNDVLKLLKMLHSIYPQFQHRSIKSRCTRLQKRIRKQLNLDSTTNNTDADSDSSVMSQSSFY